MGFESWKHNRVADWVDREQGNHLCACGCGQPIEIKRDHRKRGIPKYIHGHNSNGETNPSFKGVDQWVDRHQGQVICACGCGKPVLIRKHHFHVGIPSFIHGHNQIGEQNNKWQGGISKHDRRRASAGIRKWRKKVWERDKGRCQMPGCPNPETKDIQSHHIIPFMESEELRFETQNGITLCRFCHQSIKTREDEFEELFQSLVGDR